MNKMQMAHEWYMKHSESASFMYIEVDQAWSYADAMQAEADKREDKTRPEVLCEVDWSAAPKNAFQWQMISNEAYWRIEIMGGLDTEPAPSFGFTGTHIVERPQ